VLDAALLKDEVVVRNHRLADAAKAGRWAEVFEVLELQWVSVNQWRIGGTSWFTPLHQAAWHGASASVVTGLLERGALRSLPARDGHTAYDVAVLRGQDHLLELLDSRTSLPPERAADLDRGLASVIDSRLRLPEGIAASYGKPLEDCLRYPPVAVLPECPDQRLWFAVPGMYGGFSIALMKSNYLYVESWMRVVGGSGQAHVITHEGVTLVDEGFV
jgi:hypothetical protein